MEEILEKYEIYATYENYAILYQNIETEEDGVVTKYYIFDGKDVKTVKNTISNTYDFGYVTYSYDEEEGMTTYTVYNFYGEKLFEYVNGWVSSCYETEEGVYKMSVYTYVENEEGYYDYEYITYILK